MPAALRYTRMGPPTASHPAVQSERAEATELFAATANAMLSARAGGWGLGVGKSAWYSEATSRLELPLSPLSITRLQPSPQARAPSPDLV